MNADNKFYVISNTHWDREWRFPFERTRAMLTELFDNLLKLFRTKDNFRVYHMDAHTIIIEDYLEVKPENRAEVERYIREGRLLVGPWYTLPDGGSVSGEALVRNLLRGTKQARDMGKCMMVGYTPNGFGQPSQLPQLYAGFGIDNVLFYRGVDRKNTTQEFIWEGPDGTRALAFRFGMYARYNFFFLVYRPTVHGRKAFECWYKWAEGGLPFHICRELSYEPYYLLDFKPIFDTSKILPGLEEMLSVDAAGMTTPYVAAMQGCDSTAPDEVEANLVDEANKLLGQEMVYHASIEDYVARVREYLADKKDRLTVAKGEMRHTLQGGGQTYLHYDICGTRTYLRQANHVSEIKLEHVAEPISAVAAMMGAEYPTGLLGLAWKLMHQNHAHDSIGGCAMDRVHEDVMNRFQRADDISEEVARMSLARLVPHINTDRLPDGALMVFDHQPYTRTMPDDATLLLVFNPLPYARAEQVLDATVDFQRDLNTVGLELFDLAGRPVACQVRREEYCRPTVQKPNDIPSPFWAKRYHITLDARQVPPMGYTMLIAKPMLTSPEDVTASASVQHAVMSTGMPSRLPAGTSEKTAEGTANSDAADTLENEHLLVTVKGNGTFDVKDKATGRTYRGLGWFEDAGEVGDSWLRIAPTTDEVVTSKATRAKRTLLEAGPLMTRVRIDVKLRLPSGVLDDRSARKAERVDYPVTVTLTLRRGARRLDVKVDLNNTVGDHRLRMMFPTDLVATHAAAHMQFDVVRRAIDIPQHPSLKEDPENGWVEPPTGLEPNKWFVDISNGKHGLCVLDQGVTQYEVTQDKSRTLAFTLFRAFQNRNSFQNIDYPDQPGTQCFGPQTFRFAVVPHAGDYVAGGIMAEAFDWNVPPVVAQVGQNAGGELPMEKSFVEISPAGTLAFSGIKPAEDGSGDCIVRFWNAAETPVNGMVKFGLPVAKATRVRLDETHVADAAVGADSTIAVDNIGPKKVITLRVTLKKQNEE
ncbi:MAG: glycosyl hydrolase-related protein [Phycisphaerae bacterium]|nr:glycosyl hydrolase-related protein [Phycisphaerae bacterium]